MKRYDVIEEILECLRSWEPGVRVLGNVRADEAAAEIAALREKLETAEKERDYLLSECVRACGWKDKSWSHAAAHIYNAVVNARCDARAEKILRQAAEARVATLEAECRKVAAAANEAVFDERKLPAAQDLARGLYDRIAATGPLPAKEGTDANH